MPTLSHTTLSQSAPIHIQTLGEFTLSIHHENRTHHLKYDKAKLLLAVLAFSKQPISRTILADMLWPDSDAEKGRSRVRHALHVLRHAFATHSEGLIATHSEIGLHPELVHVDFFDFLRPVEKTSIEDIKKKLDAYSFAFLQNIKLPSNDGFLNWFQRWQSRHELELAQYRHQLVNYYVENQEQESALTYVKWWLCQTPEDETCHRYLIRLLLASGDKEAALQAYHHCKEVLNERFNTEPSMETQALLTSTLNHVPTLSITQSKSVTPQALRPIATLAITITLSREADMEINLHETNEGQLNDLKYWYKKLHQHCASHGAWVSQNNNTTLLAHFGYTSVLERPIDQAVQLAQLTRTITPGPNLQILQAIHACTTVVQHANSFDLDTVVAHHILPLVWEAQHGEVLLSPQAAARLTDNLIKFEQKSLKPLFKLAEPQNAEKENSLRMFGRIHYFDRLVQQWARYHQGQAPAFIHLKGQAGLGKTQLACAIADYVQNVEGRVLFLACQENKSSEPFYPLIKWLLQTLQPNDEPLELTRDSTQTIQFQRHIAKKHQVSLEASQALLENLLFKPSHNEQQEQRIEASFLRFLAEYQGGKQPLCLVWDDLQWADAKSLALLEKITQNTKTKIGLILGLSRDERPYPWATAQLHVTPLDRQTLSEYINYRAKSQKISREVRQFILATNINNPRYVNDILHLAKLKLPYKTSPRLTDLVAAKLHSLALSSQQTLFLAALLPSLSSEIISAALSITRNEAQKNIALLIDMGFLDHDAESQNTRCLELTKQTILRLTPESTKKALCHKIAHLFIEQDKPSAAIAHYLHNAQSPETIIWWQKAVQEALHSGSVENAVDYIYQALTSQKYVQDSSQRDMYAFENHATLANLAIATQGPAAARVISAYEDAAKSSQREDLLQSCAIFWGQWVAQHGLGNFSSALVAAQRLQQVATTAKHEIWQGWAYYAQAQYHLWKGSPNLSETLLLQSITTINLAKDFELTPGFFGGHSYALAFGSLGLTQALLGRYSPALQNTRHAIQIAQQSNAPVAIVACYLHLLRIYYLTNNLTALETESHMLLSMMPTEDQENVWYSFIKSYALISSILKNPNVDQLKQLEQTRESIEKNMPAALDGYLCTLARCYLANGQAEQALTVLGEAKELALKRDCLLVRPEVHCLQGDAWAALQRPELAALEWQKARQIAQEQHLLVYIEWVNERLTPEAPNAMH